ncbi:unnamed protein product [Strongylus vulgaris]|uniref:Uncharacterized protein n=1 Tax=Strongylus vulgaris TaxID=40348 RepID=A0A3P7LVY1_STRVU|nr:unnamed protein product [Strongylus vulgaris]
MVSTPVPSTSFHREEGITGKELDHFLKTESHSICVLDCRIGGAAIKNACRVRLPNVLFRRLVNCSLSLSTISPRLNDPDVRVVIIPDGSDGTTSGALANALRKANVQHQILADVRVVIIPDGSDGTTSGALANALRKANVQHQILADPVEEVLSAFPSLRVDEERQPSRTSGDMVCLNLNALRIEPGVPPSTDKRQVFPVQILPHLFLGNYETASDAQALKRWVLY